MLDQIFRNLIADSEVDDLDDRLIAQGSPAHVREHLKVLTPILGSEPWQPLVGPMKVNKSWQAVGLRHLYSSVRINHEDHYHQERVGEFLPMLLRTLKENEELSELVKNITIFDPCLGKEDSLVKQEQYEQLFRCCKFATHLHIIARTPINPTKFRAAISEMTNLRQLVMTVRHRIDRDDPPTRTFFRDDVEMVRFVMTMPNLESLRFGDGLFSGTLERPTIEQEATTEDVHDEAKTVQNPTAGALPPCSTLRLTTLDMIDVDIFMGEGIELLASLTLPHLKSVSLKFSRSERACAALLRCLNKWPETLDSLHIRDDASRGPSTRNFDVDYREAIDRFTHLSSINTGKDIVDLDYILSKPNLREITYNGQLSGEEFSTLIKKLEETVPGSQGKVYTYLPFLRSLRVYCRNWHLEPDDDPKKRMDTLCQSRQMRLEIEYRHANSERPEGHQLSSYYCNREIAADVRSLSSLLCA